MRESFPAMRPPRLAKGQVDPALAGQRVRACPEGRDAVMGEAAAATPYGDVAALQPKSPRSIAAGGATEQEDRRQAERDRDDGRGEVAPVAALDRKSVV